MLFFALLGNFFIFSLCCSFVITDIHTDIHTDTYTHTDRQNLWITEKTNLCECTLLYCDVTQWFNVLYTVGIGVCFPLVPHSGFGCCVYVVVLSAHEVVLCDFSYRGKPLLTWGCDSCFPLVLRSGCGCCVYVVVLYAHEVVLCFIYGEMCT